VDAQETYPQMFLTGDHNLGSGNPPSTAYCAAPAVYGPSYAVSLGTNFPPANLSVGWMDNMHSRMGNVGLTDGSVQGYNRFGLQSALQNTGDAGLVANPGPFVAPMGCSPAGVNRIQFP
jgi:hypothetical protein